MLRILITKINSKTVYALSNIVFAISNAFTSVLSVKFFGFQFYGAFSYINNIDNGIDYPGSHLRSTYEATIASKLNSKKYITDSFAMLQIFLGFLSIIFFIFFSLFFDDLVVSRISQIFILLSPTKSYLAFLRVSTKVNEDLNGYILAVLIISASNILSLLISFAYFDYYWYLLIRVLTMIIPVAILYKRMNINFVSIRCKIIFAVKQISSKSKSVFFYGVLSLLYLTMDKVLIGTFMNSKVLGYYSLSFLAYSIIQIFISSLVSADFNRLSIQRTSHFYLIAKENINVYFKFILFLQVAISIAFRTPFFKEYTPIFQPLFWFLLSSVFSIFIEIFYVHMIAKNNLLKIVKLNFLNTVSFLFFGLILSMYFNNVSLFALCFLFHQFLMFVIIIRRIPFLRKVVYLTFTREWKYIVVILISFLFFLTINIQYY